MFDKFPKTIKLSKTKSVTIRPINQTDAKKLLAFFQKLPAHDRQFLKENVIDEKVIRRWFTQLDFKKVIPLVVEYGDEIIADASLHLKQHGWSKHVGEIRVVVSKKYRKMSIALHLVKELYFLALKLKLEKLTCKMMETQKEAIKLFTILGFKKEAVLKNHVKDISGRKHNLIIMSHSVDTHWQDLENMIKDTYHNFAGDFAGAQ